MVPQVRLTCWLESDVRVSLRLDMDDFLGEKPACSQCVQLSRDADQDTSIRYGMEEAQTMAENSPIQTLSAVRQ